MDDNDVPGVEISIAGGVEEMVRGSNYCNPISFIQRLLPPP